MQGTWSYTQSPALGQHEGTDILSKVPYGEQSNPPLQSPSRVFLEFGFRAQRMASIQMYTG